MRSALIAAVMAVATAAATVVSSGTAQAANNSEQVVFSVKGQFVAGTIQQPLGFWVWCEADSSNPYKGFCNGSMYFYQFGGGEHVAGTISEGADHIYTMTLANTTGKYPIACTLTNESPTPSSGPRNAIDVSCSNPVSGMGTATGNVNITGP